MNNLFRITKDNIDNIFIEYKNKQENKIVLKTKIKTKNNNNNNINQENIDKNIIKNYKINTNNFNCEIKKNDDDNNQISNNIKNNNDDINDKKVILEYGKSGIKLDKLKKYMKKNLSILSSIDNIIKSFLDFNPNLKLNSLFENKITKNNINNENKIFWNEIGTINIESNKFLNLSINNNKYNIIDCGYIKLYDLKFTEEFINKNKIPSLNSIFTFSENIKHFSKLIKLVNYTDKYKIKINQLGNCDLIDIISQNIPSIITKINDKQNIFELDKNFTFYIKVYKTHTTSFIIDKIDKMIYYFNSVENNSSGYIFFYVVKLDSKYKIIDLNKIEQNKIEQNKIEQNKIDIKSNKKKKIVKLKNNINKNKSSSISDFSNSANFMSIQKTI
jgi:hypothetical protein